ncbi:hypothetical protein CSX00_07255 [Pseudobutyrivibrio ruminis]|uniref:DUF4367 domain-containing protein n=1 Tax=Pseudobutyrivibrio ruminis TaxID=46206 RepID=A0A2G3E9X4_9FIRM|nr:hypothetical protein [Pseudobutyrivibrio ruminis]PHU40102.1 hypothetical protein CSX00_07255 [Pseudobutyrivibrio ruminis]
MKRIVYLVGVFSMCLMLSACGEMPDYTSDHITVMTTNFTPTQETINQLEQSDMKKSIVFGDMSYEYMEKYYVNICDDTSSLESLFCTDLIIPEEFESKYLVTMNPNETGIDVVSEEYEYEGVGINLSIVAQLVNAAEYRVSQEGITEKEDITLNGMEASAYYFEGGTVILCNSDDLLYIWNVGTDNKQIIKDFISTF